jgi:hydroxyacylglutathione hydrolase
MDAWANAGNELETLNQITCSELSQMIERDEVQVIDVRGVSEYNAGRINVAENIHVGYLSNNLDRIEKEKAVVVHCETGDRSAIAASYLLNQGFTNVINLTGGYAAWVNECGKKAEKKESALA